MTISHLSILVGSLLFLVTSGPSWALSDKELVDRFYPKALADESARNKKSVRHEIGVPADLDNSGSTDYIVAAYSNTLTNVVRVLRKTPSDATLAAESNLPCMIGGLAPKVDLVDLDNDHKPEIKASFYTMRGATADWYFKWTGSSLQFVGPSEIDEKGWLCTAVSSSSAIDIDGSGLFAIIDGPDHLAPDADDAEGEPNIKQVYVLSKGAYVKGPRYYFDNYFQRRQGPPVEEQDTFIVDDVGRSYIFHIVNGLPDGTRRVSSAEIWFNGKLIVTPNRFSKKERFIDVPIKVQKKNALSVILKSEPKGLIQVIVEVLK